MSVQIWHEKFDKFWLEHLKNSKNYTLIGCLWPKYIMFKLKKVQRNYFWWHWRLMQNLKENWQVLSKMTWGIWDILVHRLENSNFILESKKTELNQNKKFKTTRFTRCSVNILFYLCKRRIVQLQNFLHAFYRTVVLKV